MIASATTAPLRAGDSSQVTFFGNWPGVSGSYYLIAVVTAPDDANQGSKFLASGALSVTAAVVNYTVTSVTYTGGTPYPASPVSGNLQFRNNGANGGTQYVTWQVYASKINTLDSSASLHCVGVESLSCSGCLSPVINFSGVWPLTYGNYHLIAQVDGDRGRGLEPRRQCPGHRWNDSGWVLGPGGQ